MMKISTRSRYGLRLMLELGLRHGKGPTFLKEIARNQEISEKYLSQIIIPLKTAGLVTSFRGAHGGYSLQRPPASIRLREIVGVLEGDFNLVECAVNPKVCSRSAQCVTQGVWTRVGQAIADTLEGITLQDLIDDFHTRGAQVHCYAI